MNTRVINRDRDPIVLTPRGETLRNVTALVLAVTLLLSGNEGAKELGLPHVGGPEYTQSELSKLPQRTIPIEASTGIEPAIYKVDKELSDEGLFDVKKYVNNQADDPEHPAFHPDQPASIPEIPGHVVPLQPDK